MAVAIYGYDPRDDRSPTTKEIVDELQRVGISINEDNVRAKLKKAAKAFGHLLPKLDED